MSLKKSLDRQQNLYATTEMTSLTKDILPLTQFRTETTSSDFRQNVDAYISKLNQTDKPSMLNLPILDSYQLLFFFNTSAQQLPTSYFSQLCECYCTLFNTSWNENWNLESAKKNIESITSHNDGTPLIGLLLHENKVIGFIISKIKNTEKITTSDFPYSLSADLKEDSVNRTQYVYQNILNSNKVLIIQEIGIIPHDEKSLQNKLLSPYLCYPAIKNAHHHKTSSLLFWTNTASQAFNWGISIKWYPFHFYQIDNLVLMQGSTGAFLESAHKLFPEKIRQHAKELKTNKNHYLCKI